MTPEEHRELAQRAALARWAKEREKAAQAASETSPDSRESVARVGREPDTRDSEHAPFRIEYNGQADVLEIFFEKPGSTINTRMVVLAEDVYARIVPDTQRVIGLTIHRFRARGARFGFPLEGGLSLSTPQAAENIEKALGG